VHFGGFGGFFLQGFGVGAAEGGEGLDAGEVGAVRLCGRRMCVSWYVLVWVG
jgi:hypothetical protein